MNTPNYRDLNKPVIGVTMGYSREGHPPAQNPINRFEYFKQQYYEILEDLEAVVVPLPNTRYVEHSDYYFNFIDGLLLVGGADINPRLYDSEVSPKTGPFYVRRDNFEREMVFKAVSRKMPILGICRGHQLINVIFGGSLYQDLDERVESTLNHRQTPELDFSNSHEIEIVPDTRLARIFAESRLEVNSAHHQIVRRIPEGLRTAAFASDGVVEALEGTDEGYIQTVQWHPEMQADTEFSVNLFKDFISAVREFRLKSR